MPVGGTERSRGGVTRRMVHVSQMRRKIEVLRGRLATVSKFRLKDKPRKKAAVLIPICSVNGIPSILYNVRSKSLPTHGGEVSFPGGSREKGDKDEVHTALREAYEEMGLNRDRVEVIGQLEEVPSKHGLGVTPVVGVISGDIDLTEDPLINPSSKEIEVNFTVPIVDLFDDSHWKLDSFGRFGKFPRYVRAREPIWGMTAYLTKRILAEIEEVEIGLRGKGFKPKSKL